MRYVIDMLHHNPGDAPFDTNFEDPEYIKGYGYNGQAFKHINTITTLDAIAPGAFPANEKEREWLKSFTADREKEIYDAKDAGLEVYYHIDLFVLPKAIVEKFRDEITDPATGRISVDREKTLEIHRALFDEVFKRYPEIDGFIVRVGETYLFDTPYHTGDGAVEYCPERPIEDKHADFDKLLNFLRDEICVKHNKKLIHRTWDTWPNRFHANKDFYLTVTDKIEPHPNLIFSIKHTAYDFHRWVPFNPCLTEGKHQQVIEVQCQREYEGKGAYANYAIKGVIDGFKEPGSEKGIKEIINHPLVQGIYTWSRGGGWFGPMVTRENELWCDLNAYVIAQYANNPTRSEESIFAQYCRDVLNLNAEDTAVFREIALTSLDALVKGKCCEKWDINPDNRVTFPTNQWMRDDVIQGYDRLGDVFDYLHKQGETEDALKEKLESVELWGKMRTLCNQFSKAIDPKTEELITTTVEHGLRFFSLASAIWQVLSKARHAPNSPELPELLSTYDSVIEHYKALPEEYPLSASLYRAVGWHWPTEPEANGVQAEVDKIKAALSATA